MSQYEGQFAYDPLEDVKRQVKPPATAMLVLGLIFFAVAFLAFMSNVLVLLGVMQYQPAPIPAEITDPTMRQVLQTLQKPQVDVFLKGLSSLGAALIAVAGWRMRQLKSRPLAIAGSITLMIPVASLCCPIGLPFGIWALVVLMNSDVREAFAPQTTVAEANPWDLTSDDDVPPRIQ